MRSGDSDPRKRIFRNIVVLSGAGLSQESGLDTFRDRDGIWSRVNIDDVATPQAFARNPVLVYDFYNARRRQLLSGAVHPNAAHLALVTLQRLWQGRVTLITQNIDDLQERAGSREVIHMHGEILKARCNGCDQASACMTDLTTESECPACRAKEKMRPDVVWFGELPRHMDVIYEALDKADLFLSIGTSGTVYPAAGFVEIAKRAGAHTVELNLEESLGAAVFDEGFYGPATAVVERYVEKVITGSSGLEDLVT